MWRLKKDKPLVPKKGVKIYHSGPGKCLAENKKRQCKEVQSKSNDWGIIIAEKRKWQAEKSKITEEPTSTKNCWN